MAGHSKWANIQHRKGRQDAVRSKLFSKLSKEITVAAKMGEPDPEKNPRAGSLGLNQDELKILEEGLENMEKSDLDGDGKFTFEEFLSAMKENEKANRQPGAGAEDSEG